MFHVILAAAAIQSATPTVTPPPPITTIPRRSPVPHGTPIPREVAQNQVLDKMNAALANAPPDPEGQSIFEETIRLEASLPEIARRKPFDASALSKAYGDLLRAIGRGNARRAELMMEQLGKLSPEERELAIERIPLLSRSIVTNPTGVPRP